MDTAYAPVAVALSVATVVLGFSSPYAVPLRYASVLVLAGVWLALLLHPRWLRSFASLRLISLGVVATAIAVLLAAIVSPVPADSLTWGFRESSSAPFWVASLIVFAGASIVVVNRRVCHAVGLGVALVTVAGIVAVAQRFAGVDQSETVWGGSNFLGPLCVLVAPVALGLARTGRDATERAAWRAAAVLAAGAALGSGSTSAAVGLLAAVALAVVWRPGLIVLPQEWRRVLRHAVIGLAIAAAAVVLGLASVSGGSLLDGVADSIRVRLLDVSVTQRFELWRVALGAGGARPLLGWGPGAFQYASQGFVTPAMLLAENAILGTPDPRTVLPGDPHSFPLSVFAETGAVGLLAFGLLVAGWLSAVRIVPKGPESLGDLRAAFAIGVLGFAVCSLAVPVDPGIGAIVVVFAGLAVQARGLGYAAKHRPGRADDPTAASGSGRPGPIALGVVVVWLAIALGLSVPFVRATAVVDEAFRSATDASQLAERLEGARRLQPGRSVLIYQVLWAHANRLGGDLDFTGLRTRFDEAPRAVTRFAPFGTELVSIAVSRQPSAEVLAWADGVLDELGDVAPGYPDSRIERARVAVLQGDTVKARRLLAEVGWASGSDRYQSVERLLPQQ